MPDKPVAGAGNAITRRRFLSAAGGTLGSGDGAARPSARSEWRVGSERDAEY